jgi:hypothetical protein
MLHRFGFPGLYAADAGHIYIFCLEKSAGNIAIDGFFTDFKAVGIVDCDVMDRVATLDERRNQFVKVEQLILSNVCTGAGFYQHFTICIVGLFMEIIFFPQYALALFHTAVADIGRVIKLDAQPLLEFLAYSIAVITAGTLSRAVGFIRTELYFLADI